MQHLIEKKVHDNCSDQGEYQNGVLMLTLDEYYFFISDKNSKNGFGTDDLHSIEEGFTHNMRIGMQILKLQIWIAHPEICGSRSVIMKGWCVILN